MHRCGIRPMVRIGVVVDGRYFDEVSRFCEFQHPRGSRLLSLAGLHGLIRALTAECEGVGPTECQVVKSHYFRGRLPASEVEAAGKLKAQALFEAVLLRAGVMRQYLPVSTTSDGRIKEQGIDVCLALEVYDLAVHEGFDVGALVVCVGDLMPPVRKMTSSRIGTLVLAWDFDYEFELVTDQKRARETPTAYSLVKASTCPVLISPLSDAKLAARDPLAENLFVQ